jgi:TetR/AcrR family transcriptional regulator
MRHPEPRSRATTVPQSRGGSASSRHARSRTSSRPRGRPPQSAAEQDAARARILDATRAVFASVGYHGLSVELVLAEAGISRPTFYRYFRNVDEAIDRVLRDVNERLIDSLTDAVRVEDAPLAVLEAGLSAWLAWGDALGPMLRPLFAELHDPRSPASRHRLWTLGILTERVSSVAERLGRARPAPLLVDTLLNGIEFLGYRHHLAASGGAASRKATRDAMLRLALGLLGTEAEWARAVPLARELGVELGGVQPRRRSRGPEKTQ